MSIKFTKLEDSILPKKILARTDNKKIDEGYYKWTVQIFLRYKGKRVIETHYFWLFNMPRSIGVIEYLAKELRRYGQEWRVVGIAAFNGEKIIVEKRFTYISVAKLESND